MSGICEKARGAEGLKRHIDVSRTVDRVEYIYWSSVYEVGNDNGQDAGTLFTITSQPVTT